MHLTYVAGSMYLEIQLWYFDKIASQINLRKQFILTVC